MTTADQIGAELSMIRPPVTEGKGSQMGAASEAGPSNASFSSFDGASFKASQSDVSHIGDAPPAAPPSNKEGKRAAKETDRRNSSREEFVEELKASASAGPGRSGRKGSSVSVRRRDGLVDSPHHDRTDSAAHERTDSTPLRVDEATVAERPKSSARQVGPSTSLLAQPAELERRMEEAASRLDFAAAASLQQDLEAAKQASLRYLELQQAMQAAAAGKDYTTAAKLQAELMALEEATPSPAPSADGVGLAC